LVIVEDLERVVVGHQLAETSDVPPVDGAVEAQNGGNG